MAREVSCWPLTGEVLVQAQADTCVICGGKYTATGFSESLGCALAVSFHHCSTIITSCITDAIKLYHLIGALNDINKRLRF